MLSERFHEGFDKSAFPTTRRPLDHDDKGWWLVRFLTVHDWDVMLALSDIECASLCFLCIATGEDTECFRVLSSFLCEGDHDV